MAKKPTGPAPAKAADPLDALGIGLAADHKAAQLKTNAAITSDTAEAADTVAAGAIEGAGAALAAGGDARDVAAATVGGAAAATAEVTGENETPPAPGDEPDAVFARRMDRLMLAAEQAEFESGTIVGDLRAALLDLFRLRPQLWSAMKPSDQNDLSRQLEKVAQSLVRKIVQIVAEEESLTVAGTFLGKFAVNGEAVEAKIKIDNVDADVMLDIYKMSGHRIVLVSADDKRFASSRRDHPNGDDQIPMAFAEDKPKAPSEIRTDPPVAPAGDTDLNPDPESIHNTERQAEPTGEADVGVFDKEVGEWLIDENGGDDGWTKNTADAGRWTFDEAKKLADDFAGDNPDTVVARSLGDDPTPAADDARTHDETSAVDD
jgi:hypothetical protein